MSNTEITFFAGDLYFRSIYSCFVVGNHYKMFITALAILLMFMHHTRSEVCLADQKYPACRCVNSDGKIIDLRSVGSKTKPRLVKQ